MKFICSLVLAVAVCNHVSAQGVTGKMVDDKKEPLINAVVRTYSGSSLVLESVTDFDGNYMIKPLDAGKYDVLFSMEGYDSLKTTGVIVRIGSATFVNGQLLKARSSSHCKVVPYKVPLVECDVNRTYKIDCRETDVSVKQSGPPADISAGSNAQVWVNIGCAVSGKVMIDPVICATLPSRLVLYNVPQPGHYVLQKNDLARFPASNINEIASMIPGIYQPRRRDGLNIFGARNDGNLYVIDGVWQ